jgi:hypothetical protein
VRAEHTATVPQLTHKPVPGSPAQLPPPIGELLLPGTRPNLTYPVLSYSIPFIISHVQLMYNSSYELWVLCRCLFIARPRYKSVGLAAYQPVTARTSRIKVALDVDIFITRGGGWAKIEARLAR